MKTLTPLFAAALLFGLSGTPAIAAMPAQATAASPAVAAPKLHEAMRALWHGHVVHTRDYALAVHAHDPAKAKAAATAVVGNAKQIAAAVGSFYGEPAGAQMLKLLAGHWGGVQALTDARAADDAVGQRNAMMALNANVDAIAAFLAGANPNLPQDAVRGLLATHVAHHATQIQQIMGGDVRGEQGTWQAMQQHMDMVADALAGAIAKQFPAKAG